MFIKCPHTNLINCRVEAVCIHYNHEILGASYSPHRSSMSPVIEMTVRLADLFAIELGTGYHLSNSNTDFKVPGDVRMSASI